MDAREAIATGPTAGLHGATFPSGRPGSAQPLKTSGGSPAPRAEGSHFAWPRVAGINRNRQPESGGIGSPRRITAHGRSAHFVELSGLLPPSSYLVPSPGG